MMQAKGMVIAAHQISGSNNLTSQLSNTFVNQVPKLSLATHFVSQSQDLT